MLTAVALLLVFIFYILTNRPTFIGFGHFMWDASCLIKLLISILLALYFFGELIGRGSNS